HDLAVDVELVEDPTHGVGAGLVDEVRLAFAGHAAGGDRSLLSDAHGVEHQGSLEVEPPGVAEVERLLRASGGRATAAHDAASAMAGVEGPFRGGSRGVTDLVLLVGSSCHGPSSATTPLES